MIHFVKVLCVWARSMWIASSQNFKIDLNHSCWLRRSTVLLDSSGIHSAGLDSVSRTRIDQTFPVVTFLLQLWSYIIQEKPKPRKGARYFSSCICLLGMAFLLRPLDLTLRVFLNLILGWNLILCCLQGFGSLFLLLASGVYVWSFFLSTIPTSSKTKKDRFIFVQVKSELWMLDFEK